VVAVIVAALRAIEAGEPDALRRSSDALAMALGVLTALGPAATSEAG
jgi:hypothetical protein